MDVMIRQADIDDLEAVTALEQLCFTPAEAASKEAMRYRLTHYPMWFYVAELDKRIIGLCDGCASDSEYITDDLFEAGGKYNPDGKNFLIFGLAVHPDFRRRHIGAELLEFMAELAKNRGIIGIGLTCREELIGYYEGLEFEKIGLSKSVHGGIVWYDMRRKLE